MTEQGPKEIPEKDDFDRRSDQGMWTTQYDREGEYPKSGVPGSSASVKPQPPKRVYGSNQLLIADNDPTVKDTHARAAEEQRLRAEMTEEERVTGAEQARAILSKFDKPKPDNT